jgi:hypothetical protein
VSTNEAHKAPQPHANGPDSKDLAFDFRYPRTDGDRQAEQASDKAWNALEAEKLEMHAQHDLGQVATKPQIKAETAEHAVKV